MTERRADWGPAWVILCLSLALHVADEAAHDFLSVWNPLARSARASLPWLPFPVFTFEAWIAGLAVAVIVLLGLSPFAFANARGLRPLGWLFAVVMLGNGLLHFAASAWFGRWAPGVLSSPLLIAGSLYLLVRLRRSGRRLTEHR